MRGYYNRNLYILHHCRGDDMSCTCEGKRNDKIINWGVVQRYCNHSAFNGYHRTASDYSTIVCIECRSVWRTKADYVGSLPDAQLNNGGWELKK